MKNEKGGNNAQLIPKLPIEGIKILKTLVTYKGVEILHKRLISLQLIEDWTLRFYALPDTPTNRLYVYIQLVQYFRERGMWLGNFIIIPDEIFQRLCDP